MQTRLLPVVMLCLLLVGCSSEPVTETPVVPDKRPVMSEFSNGSISMNSITPRTSYEDSGDVVYIYPYNNSDEHITIEKILVSDCGFWTTVISEYSESNNLVVRDRYSLITLSDGTTYGYIANSEDTAYVLRSSLPSSYVEAVLDNLWISGT